MDARFAGMMLCSLALAGLLAVAGARAEDRPSFMHVSSAPPPGFEDLAGPQTTEVDVYFTGQPLLSTLARYDLETIEFLEPDALTEAIPRLIDASAMRAALSAPLPTNAANLCTHPAQTDCGTLDPGVVGVIFDESRFRVDLFVNRLQLEAQTLHQSRFLGPSSTPGLSTMHLFSVSASGGGEDSGAFDLGATSLLAKGEDRLHSRYDLSDDGFSVNALSWQRDRGQYRYEAGLFRSLGRGATFVNEQDVVGVRAGSSLDTRTDLSTAEGTPIFLFLNQRSRVDIYRGERLLDSRFYAGGNQQLDTSRLPDGAYEIIVRSHGDDGRDTEERFFFVRTALLPPLDQPLYYAELGSLTATRPDAGTTLDSGAWARVGTARRLHDKAGVEAELLHAAGTSLVQGGAFLFGAGWQVRASLMGSGDGDSGLWLSANWHRDALAMGLDLRRVAAGDSGADRSVTAVPGSFTQGTFTLSAPLLGGRLTLRSQLDRRESYATTTSYGAAYSRPLYRRGSMMLDLDADAAIARDDRLVRLGVQMRWRKDRRNTTVRPRIEYSSSDRDGGTRALLDARTSTQRESDRYGQITQSAFALRDADRTVLGASVASDSARGRGNLEAEYVSGNEDGHLAYAANAAFAVAGVDGDVALGGRRNELAALMIDVAAPDDDMLFDVIVDEQTVATARAGGRTIVGLQPYRRYDVRLAPRGESIVEIDQGTRTVTLYPGNVHTLRYAPKTLTVLVGQALWDDGTPVARARFTNVDGFGGTDENGWFQVEVTSLAPLELDARGRGACTLTLGAVAVEQGLAVLPPLTCVPTPASP